MKIHIVLSFVLLLIAVNTISISTMHGLNPYLLFESNIESRTVEIDYQQWVTADTKSISLLIYIEIGSGPNSYAFVTVENEVDTHFNLVKPTQYEPDQNIYSETFTINVTGSRKLVMSGPKDLGAYIYTRLYFINQYK